MVGREERGRERERERAKRRDKRKQPRSPPTFHPSHTLTIPNQLSLSFGAPVRRSFLSTQKENLIDVHKIIRGVLSVVVSRSVRVSPLKAKDTRRGPRFNPESAPFFLLAPGRLSSWRRFSETGKSVFGKAEVEDLM